jgi:hypothetical protein
MYSRFFLNRRLFYTLYQNLTYHALRSAARKAKKKKRDAVSVFLAAIERRIDTMLYRSGFFLYVFLIRQFIKHKKVVLKGRPLSNYSKIVRFYDILSIRRESRLKVFRWMFYKLRFFKKYRINLFFASPPPHLELSYKLLAITFLPHPKLIKSALYFPGKLDPELMLHSYKAGRR